MRSRDTHPSWRHIEVDEKNKIMMIIFIKKKKMRSRDTHLS